MTTKKQQMIDLILASDKRILRVRVLELAYRRRYGKRVSRATANAALNDLAKRGLVRKSNRMKGKNTCWYRMGVDNA